MPNCIRQLLEYTYPTVDWTTVTLHDGFPHVLNWKWTAGDKDAVTLPSFRGVNHVDVYFNNGKWDPCNCVGSGGGGLGLIAHEGFHVLQMKDLMGGYGLGYISLNTIRYLSCSFTELLRGNDSYRDNDLEIEAYAFAGTPTSPFDICCRKAGSSLPCDCDCMPPSVSKAGMANYIANCPTSIRNHSEVDFSKYWGSLADCIIGLNKVGELAKWFYSKTCKAHMSWWIRWLPCLVGVVLSLLTWIVYGIYYFVWFLVFFIAAAVLEILNIILGVVDLLVAGIVGAIEGLVDAVTGLFSSPSSYIWSTSYDSTQWVFPDARLSTNGTVKTSDSPSLASLGTQLVCAYKSSDNSDIWYDVFDGTNWLATDIKVTRNGHTRTNAAPALAEYNGKLYMAYKSSGGSDIWYNVFDGTNWLDNDIKITRNGRTRTNAAPALAVYNGKLYMVYKSGGGSDIWYNVFDGTNWLDEDIKITRNGHTRTSAAPALAVYNGKLYMAYKSGSFLGTELWYNVFDGTRWLGEDIKISHGGKTRTNAAPALAEYAGSLYLVYKSGGGTDIWYNIFDGKAWRDEDCRLTTENRYRTARGPALAGFAARLFLAYRDAS